MTQDTRPLSPHIQIYKPQISSITSILNRLTGIFLYLGIVMMCWAIVYYTYQVDMMIYNDSTTQERCECLWWQVLSCVFYTVVLVWIFSLYYHLFNGIRHLFWDIGKGFCKETSKKTGILVLLLSVVSTIISIYYIIFL